MQLDFSFWLRQRLLAKRQYKNGQQESKTETRTHTALATLARQRRIPNNTGFSYSVLEAVQWDA